MSTTRIAAYRTRALQHGHPERRLAHFLSASRQRRQRQLPVRPERQDVQNDHVPGDIAELCRVYRAMSGLTIIGSISW